MQTYFNSFSPSGVCFAYDGDWWVVSYPCLHLPALSTYFLLHPAEEGDREWLGGHQAAGHSQPTTLGQIQT